MKYAEDELCGSLELLRTDFCAVVCHKYINNIKYGKQFPTNVVEIVVT